MKISHIIVLIGLSLFSCDRKQDETPKPTTPKENIYDKTKIFKSNFKFIINEQDKNVESYWFHVDTWQRDPCCSTKLRSDGIKGWKNMFDSPYRINTKILDTDWNYLNDKFVISITVTDKVKRGPWELIYRMYKSDTLKFESIKDSLRIIRYPQDTLTLLKRYYPPGHPKYDPNKP